MFKVRNKIDTYGRDITSVAESKYFKQSYVVRMVEFFQQVKDIFKGYHEATQVTESTIKYNGKQTHLVQFLHKEDATLEVMVNMKTTFDHGIKFFLMPSVKLRVVL